MDENMKELQNNYYFKHLEEFEHKILFENCTYPWEVLTKLNEYIEEKVAKENLKINNAQVGDFVSISGNYIIGEGTNIHSFVCIEGPVIIGKNCTIQSGALIRPYTIIGDNCVIGHGAEIKHAIIQNKAKVQSMTFAGDSIIGKSTRVGSGTILSNRRFDQQNARLKYNGEKIDLKSDFFGAVLGDNTRLGANCTTLPGTFIGPYTWVLPGIEVRNFIPEEKRLIPNTNYRIENNPKIELK